jgi:hypothetical protein
MRHELNFLEFLQNFRRGELLADGDTKINELAAAMREHGAGGEFTLKLKFKMNKAGQLVCSPTVSIKKPAREMGDGIFFLSDDGRLSRRDPNQMDIEDEIHRRRDIDVN